MSRRLAAILAAVLMMAGCQNAVVPQPRGPMPKTPSALASYYGQHLAWFKCGAFACAWLSVPLDYAHPNGQKIRLAVLKVAATDPKDKVGALVVNPGGPGASGRQF
ncbi:MAG: alpha/beta hydrolase, partial [Marmoricola sp.]